MVRPGPLLLLLPPLQQAGGDTQTGQAHGSSESGGAAERQSEWKQRGHESHMISVPPRRHVVHLSSWPSSTTCAAGAIAAAATMAGATTVRWLPAAGRDLASPVMSIMSMSSLSSLESRAPDVTGAGPRRGLLGLLLAGAARRGVSGVGFASPARPAAAEGGCPASESLSLLRTIRLRPDMLGGWRDFWRAFFF
jgi:hypothetical protein